MAVEVMEPGMWLGSVALIRSALSVVRLSVEGQSAIPRLHSWQEHVGLLPPNR